MDPTFTPGTSFFRDQPLLLRAASIAEADRAFVRFHPFWYTKEWVKYMDRLWDKTIIKLDFPEVHKALGP